MGSQPHYVTTCDFNGDNNQDIAVANKSDNNLSIFIGNGDGTFQAKVEYATGNMPIYISVYDFNKDNNPDLAIANMTGSIISILLGNGDGDISGENEL